MLNIKKFTFNPFGENTYIISDPDSRKALIVDPGMVNSREQKMLDDYIEQNKLSVKAIINTHLHLDHCFGNNYLREKYNVLIGAHPDDAFLGQQLPDQARAFGLAQPQFDPVNIDTPMYDGNTIMLGNNRLELIHVPGHSPGSLVIYSATDHFAIVGDVLFRGSIGRTDLPGGNYGQLISGIKEKILSLPDDTVIYPGHDASTTVREEKRTNPYLR